MAVRASLTESNAELQAELRTANEDLGELRAHYRANLHELERLRRFESDGLDLERLARVLHAARERIQQREDMLMQVTRAYESASMQLTWANEQLERTTNANAALRLEVLDLKQLAERRRRDAEATPELRQRISALEQELTRENQRRLRLELELDGLRNDVKETPSIEKKDWRLLAQLVHPDVHVEGRKARAEEAMLLLNTKLRPRE